MKKYKTPYGGKTSKLLKLSMEAYTREESAENLIVKMAEKLKEFAPTDASHEGLQIVHLLADAQVWIELKRLQTLQIEKDEENA